MKDQSTISRRSFLKATAGLAGGSLVAHRPPPAMAAIGGNLNMIGWEGYDLPDAAKPFQAKHGITLNVTYIGSNDEVLTKFQAGGPGRYDVGDITSRFIQPMIEQKMLTPLDEARLPNFKQVYPQFQNVDWARRDGKLYAVPAYFGFDVINYNADFLKQPPKTWDVLIDPQYKGKVGFYDNPSGTMFFIGAIVGVGADGTKYTKADLQKIIEWGKKWKANSKTLVKSYGEMTDLLVRGDIWLGAIGWQYVTVQGQKQRANLADALPDGPAKAWCDSYFIFAGATNLDTAYAWIDNAITPEVMAKSGPALNSMVTNAKAAPLLPQEHAKLMGYDKLNDQLGRAVFSVFPPARAADAHHISLDELLRGYEQIKAS
jgi:spermidine/putrescine transport system substrate-binding protein